MNPKDWTTNRRGFYYDKIKLSRQKGNCLDNSVMENFFGKMKNEMFYGREYEFESLEYLKKEMKEYITYYNEKRIKAKLKGLTPLQYRNQSLQFLKCPTNWVHFTSSSFF